MTILQLFYRTVACATAQKIDSSYSTQVLRRVLASCTTCLCLCKSFKELSLFALLVRKAGAKVQLFSEQTKLFEEKFGVICTIISLFDICQVTFWTYTLLYYIREGRFRGRRNVFSRKEERGRRGDYLEEGGTRIVYPLIKLRQISRWR